MGEMKSLGDACRAVGLDCRCVHQHSEPRFRLAIDQQVEPPLLHLAIRNDDSITPHPVHADPAVPAVLFEVVEETVCREPIMNIWLPATERHRFVVWREGEVWKAGKLNGVAAVDTAAAAVELIRNQFGDDEPPR